MKKIVLFVLMLSLSLWADFFKTEAKVAQEVKAEKAHFCEFFTKKAIDYEKDMRDDELAHITLFSYKKRAAIYCSDKPIEAEKEVKEKVIETKKIEKNIALEDERLCKVFQEKMKRYKATMRDDELAYTTLESYKQRAYIFCSKESLEKKEQAVLNEDKKLCEVFQQGPKLCNKFEKEHMPHENTLLAEETKKSFQKRAKVFCSSKPLHEKDKNVYQENRQLCQLYYDNIKSFKMNVKENNTSKEALDSLKKRVDYFCLKNTKKKK